jgi:hypothetical protein
VNSLRFGARTTIDPAQRPERAENVVEEATMGTQRIEDRVEESGMFER